MMIVAIMVAIAVIASLMATSTRNAIEGLGNMSSCLGSPVRRNLPERYRPAAVRGYDAGQP